MNKIRSVLKDRRLHAAVLIVLVVLGVFGVIRLASNPGKEKTAAPDPTETSLPTESPSATASASPSASPSPSSTPTQSESPKPVDPYRLSTDPPWERPELQANGPSLETAVAGQWYVAFTSSATNLVPGDTNGAVDVFFHDRQTGKTSIVSVSSSEADANGRSGGPSTSNDGRYVAFWSDASNLVASDGNGKRDAFVRDRIAGTTIRVSLLAATGSTGAVGDVMISRNGDVVVFDSAASNLVPGDTNGKRDVFLRDLSSKTTIRVSAPTSGEANGDSFGVGVSRDGRYVAFASKASNLVENDTDGNTDVFLWDRNDGSIEAASDAPGIALSGGAQLAGIGPNGAYVFLADAAGRRAFRYEIASGQGIELDVPTTSGSVPNASMSGFSVTYDSIVFESSATNLDPQNYPEGWVRSRPACYSYMQLPAHQQLTIMVYTEGNDAANGASRSCTSTGDIHVYVSDATNLVRGDTNGETDVFVWEGMSGAVSRVSVLKAPPWTCNNKCRW